MTIVDSITVHRHESATYELIDLVNVTIKTNEEQATESMGKKIIKETNVTKTKKHEETNDGSSVM